MYAIFLKAGVMLCTLLSPESGHFHSTEFLSSFSNRLNATREISLATPSSIEFADARSVAACTEEFNVPYAPRVFFESLSQCKAAAQIECSAIYSSRRWSLFKAIFFYQIRTFSQRVEIDYQPVFFNRPSYKKGK